MDFICMQSADIDAPANHAPSRIAQTGLLAKQHPNMHCAQTKSDTYSTILRMVCSWSPLVIVA